MSERRATTSNAESIAEAVGLPVPTVRAFLNHEDVRVVDAVKVGGFLRLPVKEMTT